MIFLLETEGKMNINLNLHKSLFTKIALAFGFLLLSVNSFAKEIPAKSNKLVNDYIGALSASEVNALETKLSGYYDTTSTQIAVVIENSLEGDDLFDFSQRLATAWGIGEKGKNNGVLIYVAVADRKVRIHTGYGMEATITDAMSTRIRTQQMNPAFKAGNYYQGLDEATTTIMQLASGEYVNDNDETAQKGPSAVVIIVIVLVILVLFSRGGGGRGNRSRGGFGGPVFWGGTFGSGGFSDGGGGGFGGFGGGGFGGGGSGGSW
jgi:uncharacterized protein